MTIRWAWAGFAGIALAGLALARRPADVGITPLLDPATGNGRGVRYLIDTAPPREPVTLLFLRGRPAIALTDEDTRRAVVLEAGGIILVDDKLTATSVALDGLGATTLSAAPVADGGWWLSSHDGGITRVDAGGEIIQQVAVPFAVTALWPDGIGGAIATRSAERFAFAPEPADLPQMAKISPNGVVASFAGPAIVPAHALLATLNNVGFAVAVGDTVAFAPLVRPEIIAFGPAGDTLWVRGAAPAVAEPRFVVRDRRAAVDYQVHTLGMTLGPDRRLYRLRSVDSLATQWGLDIIEPGTGELVGNADLGDGPSSVAVGRSGRLYRVNDSAILGAVGPDAREPFPSFALDRRGGGQVRLEEYRGRLLLVNFWASWCLPCRTEMPALDSLQASLEGPDFAFVALNADGDRGDADEFVERHGFRFEVGYGGPALERNYRYPGLPYTVLVDGEGRLIRRWIGQLSTAAFESIRLLVADERRQRVPEDRHQHAH